MHEVDKKLLASRGQRKVQCLAITASTGRHALIAINAKPEADTVRPALHLEIGEKLKLEWEELSKT